jgi:hypothetical protein
MKAREKSLYYNLLYNSEKSAYDLLQSDFDSHLHRYNRNHRTTNFRDELDQIRQFCEGPDAWRRYLACGICWGLNFIATNTLQLRFLLGKSKSSINGCFAQMGFDICPSKDCDNTELFAKIPALKGRAHELRQWTIRKMTKPNSSDDVPVEPNRFIQPEDIDFPLISFPFDDRADFDRALRVDQVHLERSLHDPSPADGQVRFNCDDGWIFGD